MDLEHTFFRQIFTTFVGKFKQVFSAFVNYISLKYSNLGITPVKITEIQPNSEKICENWRKIARAAVPSENQQKLRRVLQNYAKVLKNHRNLEWCKGKNVDLVKSFPTSIYLQKSASIQPRTSLSKLWDLHLLGPENFFTLLHRCTADRTATCSLLYKWLYRWQYRRL